MPSPSRYQNWTQPLLNGRLGQSDVEEPDPEPDDPTDYVSQDEGGAVQVAFRSDIITPADDLNETDGTVTNGGGTFPLPFINPANSNDGNQLTYAERGAGAPAAGTYTSILKTDLGAAFNVTVVLVHGRYGSSSDPAWTLEHSAAGSSWTATPITYSWDGVGHTATMTLVTPTSDRWWRIINTRVSGGGIVQGLTVYTWAITGSVTTLGDVQWYPAPAVNDGDTGTSALSNVLTDPCLRVYLLEQRLIYLIELDIGQETAGATVYELYGTDEPDFSSTTLLATLSFTATGSYTLDTVGATWVPTGSFAYYELIHVSGGGDDREFYEVRMYSAASSGGGVTSHPLLTGRTDADQHPADAITVTDAGGWFTGDDAETALSELAAKAIGYQAHGNTGTTETFDAAYGWHSATLNNNCTFTLTAAPSGTASSLFLELTQDGTGGRTITLPSSVANKTDIEADQDTTLSTTSFLILLSRDGGTTWYGSWWGQDGGGSAITVEDEGSPLTGDATALDFTGAGVTASGAGGTKTINIPGGGAGTGQGLVDFAVGTRTAGNVTCNSTTWANVDTGTDCVVSASSGDRLKVTLSAGAFGTEAVTLNLTAMSIVSGSPVNDFATATTPSNTTNGIAAWRTASGASGQSGGGIIYPCVSGDISGGTVTVRLRYRTASATNRVLTASDPALVFMVENIGQAL